MDKRTLWLANIILLITVVKKFSCIILWQSSKEYQQSEIAYYAVIDDEFEANFCQTIKTDRKPDNYWHHSHSGQAIVA